MRARRAAIKTWEILFQKLRQYTDPHLGLLHIQSRDAYLMRSDVQVEVEQLRLELRNFVHLYNRACEDLVYAQNKVQILSSDCLEESKRVNAAQKSEENFRKIAAEEKEKHVEAVKEVEMARNLLAKEAYERQTAELKGIQESLEKQRIVDALSGMIKGTNDTVGMK